MPLTRSSQPLSGAQGVQRRFRRYPSTMDAVARYGGHLRVLAGISQCGPDPIPTQPDGSVSPRTAMEATPGTPPPPSVALVRSRLRGGRLGCWAALILSTAPPQPRWAKSGGTGLPSSFAQPKLRQGPADQATTRVALDDVGWPASVDRRGAQPGVPASLPKLGASVGCFLVDALVFRSRANLGGGFFCVRAGCCAGPRAVPGRYRGGRFAALSGRGRKVSVCPDVSLPSRTIPLGPDGLPSPPNDPSSVVRPWRFARDRTPYGTVMTGGEPRVIAVECLAIHCRLVDSPAGGGAPLTPWRGHQ